LQNELLSALNCTAADEIILFQISGVINVFDVAAYVSVEIYRATR
jgi:hypothetical protein